MEPRAGESRIFPELMEPAGRDDFRVRRGAFQGSASNQRSPAIILRQAALCFESGAGNQCTVRT